MSNKYQEALKRLRTNEYLTSREQREYYNLLQELVDKETPKKPNNIKEFITFDGMVYKIAKCPNCKENNKVRTCVLGNRCYSCGQELDWSDNNA